MEVVTFPQSQGDCRLTTGHYQDLTNLVSLQPAWCCSFPCSNRTQATYAKALAFGLLVFGT